MTRQRWTPEEISQLRVLYPDTANAAIARALGRKRSMVSQKARHLGLIKSTAFLVSDQAGRKPWTAEDTALLVAMYPDSSAAVVGQTLGRKPGSVHQKAGQLGLGKSTAFFASDRAGRIQRGRQHPKMTATQFQRGLIPWNKGLNWVAGGRSAQTRFKPGTKPLGTLPVGQYRLCSDGSLQRKTSETPGPNHKRWTPVARLVWEAANGPVPAGHMVAFKPGQASNELHLITLDKLDCITRAEHARRNHPRNKSPELARLVQLKGAITRQVNRINREADEAGKQAKP